MGHAGYQLEPWKLIDRGTCDCCGGVTQSATGAVYLNSNAHGVFHVVWTCARVAKHGAMVDIAFAKSWEDDHVSAWDVVTLEYRILESGGSFMVVDSAARPLASELANAWPLSRDEVVGGPLAEEVFRVADTIWLQDERIAELVSPSWRG